jgi:hypothetical protein
MGIDGPAGGVASAPMTVDPDLVVRAVRAVKQGRRSLVTA